MFEKEESPADPNADRDVFASEESIEVHPRIEDTSGPDKQDFHNLHISQPTLSLPYFQGIDKAGDQRNINRLQPVRDV